MKELARLAAFYFQLFVAPAFHLHCTNQGWPEKKKNKNKKPLLAGAGRKKGGEIREGRPGPGFVS